MFVLWHILPRRQGLLHAGAGDGDRGSSAGSWDSGQSCGGADSGGSRSFEAIGLGEISVGRSGRMSAALRCGAGGRDRSRIVEAVGGFGKRFWQKVGWE